jgi:hypothetical protein
MALQAKQVHLATLKQARIRGAVRGMASGTTVDLYHWVLEDKWAGLVGVALEADVVACGRGAELAHFESAVLIVAIGALYKTFVDAMVEGTGERLLYF